MKKFNRSKLYETQVINEDGLDGYSFVNRRDGLRVVVSHPTNDRPGTNPEELFGLAQATCLNTTIKTLLKNKKDHPSRVTVDVQYMREEDKPGTYFQVDILVAIKDLPLDEVEKIAHEAESYCPVSKLVANSETVSLKVIPYVDNVAEI